MRSGIDISGMDRNIRPQDDLFGYVNGAWVESTPIPADRGRFGTFDILRDQAQDHVRALLEEASEQVDGDRAGVQDAGGASEEVTVARAKAGGLYASFMDTERIESLGVEPIRDELERIDAVADTEALWRLMGELARGGVSQAVFGYVNTDKRASSSYIFYLHQSGIGLPDEAYYRQEQYEEIRAAYLAHMRRMFELAGRSDPAGEADRVMELETRLAAAHWDRVASRDAVKTYTKVTRDELARLAPDVPWQAWSDGMNAPDAVLAECVVAQPSFLQALSLTVSQVDLASWQSWATWQVLHSRAPYLPHAFADENFDFYGRTLTGAPEQRDRWRRAIALVDMLVGEAAGRLYVERYFPPQAKESMVELVANLVEAYRRDIDELAWMSPQTRARAQEKLAAFTPKIGYPDTWRDYGAYDIDPGDLLGNVHRGYAFETDRDWGKLGAPVDRDEWMLSPQTVNAYYNPGMNEIVFPAAILQPPFFDAQADDAVNYGAIGSVIGHEIGHGFDDQGSRYDGSGNLSDWWTSQDRTRFDELAGALIRQYDELSTRDLPQEKVNGALTIGENIGDLGGVTISHLAYRISLGGRTPERIDGFTGDQRFFLGWAQAWRGAARPEEAKRLLALDPHAPSDLRANIVRNLVEFYDAFEVGPGDGLWLPQEERVRIW